MGESLVVGDVGRLVNRESSWKYGDGTYINGTRRECEFIMVHMFGDIGKHGSDC